MRAVEVIADIFKFCFLVFIPSFSLWFGLSNNFKLNLSFQKFLPTCCFLDEITSLYLWKNCSI